MRSAPLSFSRHCTEPLQILVHFDTLCRPVVQRYLPTVADYANRSAVSQSVCLSLSLTAKPEEPNHSQCPPRRPESRYT